MKYVLLIVAGCFCGFFGGRKFFQIRIWLRNQIPLEELEVEHEAKDSVENLRRFDVASRLMLAQDVIISLVFLSFFEMILYGFLIALSPMLGVASVWLQNEWQSLRRS